MIMHSSSASAAGARHPRARPARGRTPRSRACAAAAASWAGSCGSGNSIAALTKMQPWKRRVLDHPLHDVHHRAQLPDRGRPAALLHQLAELLLEERVDIVEDGDDQVVLALEMLVEGGLADADVAEDRRRCRRCGTRRGRTAAGGIDQACRVSARPWKCAVRAIPPFGGVPVVNRKCTRK